MNNEGERMNSLAEAAHLRWGEASVVHHARVLVQLSEEVLLLRQGQGLLERLGHQTLGLRVSS
ncbi:hypothetical protein E2C01_014184 [Portunus trituberculatus]|uniref:Uncharacterized protein n=1 Tax=Portunus trituberculatus TaxID=210409 RepID=A0A5B7DJ44_PORTR|nr:hypothetical protein [Portunus trituberculatus]